MKTPPPTTLAQFEEQLAAAKKGGTTPFSLGGPIVLLYLIFQRNFVSGLTQGAIKG